MQEYYFANYRLLVDDEISEHESMRYLSAFRKEMPYEYTFTLHLGNPALLDEKYAEALKGPVVTETTGFELRKLQNGCKFISKAVSPEGIELEKQVLECNREYNEMTLYCLEEEKHHEVSQEPFSYFLPFKTIVRVTCGIGMAFMGGLSLHASLVEKDGYGVLFAGPSGMGKSTQATLWKTYQNAEIINGDSPVIYEKNGEWFAAGIPWDGKDQIYIQRNLPIKAVIVLEQAPKNRISRMTPMQAMSALLQQVMHPVWDEKAMDRVTGLIYRCASTVPFYHLKNLPNEEATVLTHRKINEQAE